MALTNDDLGDVAFMNASIGLLVGDNGRIFRTTNGGASWSQVSSGTGNNLAAVAFGTGGMAYASGRDGTIVRSTDSGTSWTLVETGADRYRDMTAKGSQFAWAVGDEGALRATTNGGVSWFDQNPGTVSDLKGVFFLTAMEGWIAGQNSTLIHTTDGGATWGNRSGGINMGQEAVFFVNANDGWSVGNIGTIYRTINGGLNWIIEESNTSQELTNVYFTDAGHGWAIGEAGTILFRGDVVAVDDPTVGLDGQSSIRLSSFPNPFSPRTAISIRSAIPVSDALVEIYDARGRLVRTIPVGELKPSVTHVAWDGLNDFGHRMSGGTYFYRLVHSHGQSQAQKVVLLS